MLYPVAYQGLVYDFNPEGLGIILMAQLSYLPETKIQFFLFLHCEFETIWLIAFYNNATILLLKIVPFSILLSCKINHRWPHRWFVGLRPALK